LQEDVPPAARPPAVELRISLNNTREFGMVISAGLGGPDAELDEANFRKDRASVYAAAELTDAEDFCDCSSVRLPIKSWRLQPNAAQCSLR